MAIFEHLAIWLDPESRVGPEAMAVDEWLLETATLPVLRVYRWRGNWGSVGYFGKLAEARAACPEVAWVRRFTGGGTVDHRADWTYTMIAPSGSKLATMRASESYRALHEALAAALAVEGIRARLSSGCEQTGAAFCFQNPVCQDLVDETGRKLAGAGQRRTRRGLMHQGSVAAACTAEVSAQRATRIAERLAKSSLVTDFQPDSAMIERLISARYECSIWTNRR